MIPALVVSGHGVASGRSGDPRFPSGTLALQFPIFSARGLDLDGIYPGTINLDVSPFCYEIIEPKLTLSGIRWHADCPPEDFSFFDCEIAVPGDSTVARALVYYPHPDTKPEHHQAPNVLEILAPKIPNLHYGQILEIALPEQQLRLVPS